MDARYILDKKSNVYLFTGQSGFNTEQIAFGSTTPGSFAPSADGTVTTCVAIGELEQAVLQQLH
ncbi:hypothetical protein [Caballeronia sp. AZ7_KS35]|uniref:hypothetical protein n=1 Tax=Caballeronia sp. AZ7_KS35 TaxID=2921762 RepID=UPI002028AA74|nr:hypothetical protein [Caballeronia sp. AZ7_KS35]